MQRIKGLWLLIALICCFSVVWFAVPAHGWVERTVRVFVTSPANTGCISFISGMSHGDHRSPMGFSIIAALMGRTATNANTCNNDLPSNAYTLFEATFNVFLLKLVQPGAIQDQYQICDFKRAGPMWDYTRLTYNHDYPNAPCGAGYYALVACLNNAQTVFVPPWLVGTFDATTTASCNVSRWWHPVGVGNSIDPGPVVKL